MVKPPMLPKHRAVVEALTARYERDPDVLALIVIGSVARGEAHLAVDSYFYLEDYAGLPGIPPLVFTWEIECIQTYGDDHSVAGANVLVDLDRAPIPRTPGQQVSRSYLMTVRPLDAPPRFSSRTALTSKWASKDASLTSEGEQQ